MRQKIKSFLSSLAINNFLFALFLMLMVVTSFVSIVSNIMTSFPFVANIKWFAAIAMGVLGIFLLKIKRVVELYKVLIFFIIIAAVIIPSWFYGGGDNTITIMYLMMMNFIVIIIFENKFFKVCFIAFIVSTCFTLISLGHHYPDLIQPSASAQNVFVDFLIQIFIVFLVSTALIECFVYAYKKQHLKLKQLNLKLEQTASIDVLTNIFNRRKVLELLSEALEDKNKSSLHLVMTDIDNFKRINDSKGHLVGDEAIRNFASFLSYVVTDKGDIGRYGGDEFVIILKNLPYEDVLEIAAAIVTPPRFSDIELSCSAGLIDITDHHDLKTCISQADKLLFTAKENGRGRVLLWNNTVFLNKHN